MKESCVHINCNWNVNKSFIIINQLLKLIWSFWECEAIHFSISCWATNWLLQGQRNNFFSPTHPVNRSPGWYTGLNYEFGVALHTYIRDCHTSSPRALSCNQSIPSRRLNQSCKSFQFWKNLTSKHWWTLNFIWKIYISIVYFLPKTRLVWQFFCYLCFAGLGIRSLVFSCESLFFKKEWIPLSFF